MTSLETDDYEFYDVTDFEIVGDYMLRIRFDDHTEQTIDFSPVLYGPMFGPLRDLAMFNQVKLNTEIGTIYWPTGADIDPTVLHDWPDHVDTIIERRKLRFGVTA